MSTDRHQDTSKNESRIERVRQKTLRLSEKAKTITATFLEKRRQRIAWWQRTFRAPLVNAPTLFGRSQSLWLAFISMIGIVPPTSMISVRRSPARQAGKKNRRPARQAGPTRRTAVRQMIYEGLELRTMMATDLVSTILPSLVSSTGNNSSSGTSISADGKLVAFSSAASNLINGDTNSTQDIFVRDLSSGAVTRVSTDAASVQSNGTSSQPHISDDGKWVVFRSDASNLVAGDTNNRMDIFVKDLSTGAIARVSTDSASVQGNNDSSDPDISADGKFVAFTSLATNLVAGDTNNSNDIFVKDLTTGVTSRVSTNASSLQGSGGSFAPSISADGKLVAFHSNASDLVASDTNFTTDVFVKNRTTGATTRVSTSSATAQGNNFSFGANISADGKMVAYYSYANNLAASDNNGSTDVFVKDLTTGLTTLVSTSSASVQGNGHSIDPSLSPDGKFIAFSSRANNLVAGDSNSTYDIFVKDLVNGTTSRISTNSASVQSNLESQLPSISADGKVVAFESLASNLVAGDNNSASDVFAKDLNTGNTSSPSLRDFSLAVQLSGNDVSLDSSISADGNIVAFTSLANNLVASDTNGMNDVFVRNLGTGTTIMVSTSSTLQQSTGDSMQPSITSDGKLVAFASNANNLVAGDNNGSYDI
ncbi:MAG TPA: hypothetical protein VM260_05755, partial [Pirellula sp.]|nr:hypothetical protein [Pirellula sp.]